MAVDDDRRDRAGEERIRAELHRLHERCGSTTVLIHELMSFLCLKVHRQPGGGLATALAEGLAAAKDLETLEPLLVQLREQFSQASDACAGLLQAALGLGDARVVETIWRIDTQIHEGLAILAKLELPDAGAAPQRRTSSPAK